MEAISNEVMVGLGIIVTLIATKGKDFLNVAFDVAIKKYQKRRVAPSAHGVFLTLSNYLRIIQYFKYSNNPFKQAVLKEYETILWSKALEIMNEVAEQEVDNMSEAEFRGLITETLTKLNQCNNLLKEAGISERTIEVLEGAVARTRIFSGSLLAKIMTDKVYDYNSERLWAVFTILEEYLKYAHAASVDALVRANGALIGEEFKSIINTED